LNFLSSQLASLKSLWANKSGQKPLGHSGFRNKNKATI